MVANPVYLNYFAYQSIVFLCSPNNAALSLHPVKNPRDPQFPYLACKLYVEYWAGTAHLPRPHFLVMGAVHIFEIVILVSCRRSEEDHERFFGFN